MRWGLAVLLTTWATQGLAEPDAGWVPLELGADLHVHLVMAHAAAPLVHGEPGDGSLASAPNLRFVNQVDAAALRRAGVRLLFGAVWPPFRARPHLGPRELTLRELALLQDFALRRPDFALVGSVSEARAQLAVGRLAVFPQLEGGEAIASVDDVDLLYAAGVRVVTLVHLVSTQLGGAARGQLERILWGHTADGERNPEGLSPLGRAVVERMMDLGMLIDLAHASDATVADVLALTEARRVPVVISHAGARALLPLERNVSDAVARRVVEGGGLVGVTLFDGQTVTPVPHPLPRGVAGTCDDVVAHWKHLADVVGAEHLALGSDLNGFTTRSDAGGQCPLGIRSSVDLPDLFTALVGAGLERAALDGMGERVLQVLAQVERAADPARQARARRVKVPRVAPLEGPAR